MSRRHDVPLPTTRRWATTAADAVVAMTPTASLAAALGLAGGGYLVGREDVAAYGAVAGAVGVAVERWQNRGVRVRLRQERARHRGDLQEVSRLLHEVQRDLAGLRADLDDVRAERDAVRSALQHTLAELAVTRRAAAEATPPAAVAPADVAPAEAAPGEAAPADVAPAEAAAGEAAPAAAPEATPRQPRTIMLPGQVRSPIATGGIPVLTPGPSEPVRVIDLRASRSGADVETQPIPLRTPEAVDALVYAAMAQADAAELTRALELPGGSGGRHAGPLHTGDAHHAGDYVRHPAAAGGDLPTLYVVRKGRHVA